MTALRASSLFFSIALHGLALFILAHITGSGTALDRGTGLDMLRFDHGAPAEDMVILNETADAPEPLESTPIESAQAPDAPPPAALAALPEPPAHKTDDAFERAPLRFSPAEPAAKREPFRRNAHAPAQLEKAAVPERRAAPSQRTGGDADLFSAYLRRLREALERNKVNPNTELTGQVLLRMSIDPSGRVLSRDVLESSGSKPLDDAALASLDRASPLPPLPPGLGDAPLEISVPFKFRVH